VPSYLAAAVGWITLWPLPLAALVVAALAALLWKSAWTSPAFVAILALGLLGITAGVLTGLSRDSAIGAVMPAVLSLVGGLALYLLGLKHGDAKLVGSCVVALSLSLLVGTLWGALLRSEAEREDAAWADARERQKTSLQRRKLDAIEELELREFRASLGLPSVPEAQPVAASAADAGAPTDGSKTKAKDKGRQPAKAGK
jgi:hypothetical protein